jgi:hypothetical protein
MHHIPQLPVENETIQCAHLPLLLLSDNLASPSRHHVATVRLIQGYGCRCITFTCHLPFLFASLSCPPGVKPRHRSSSFNTHHCLYTVYTDPDKMLVGATHVYKLTLLLVEEIIVESSPSFVQPSAVSCFLFLQSTLPLCSTPVLFPPPAIYIGTRIKDTCTLRPYKSVVRGASLGPHPPFSYPIFSPSHQVCPH